ncbi:hypothetical protein EZS27_029405 [termite gut metagenome]|uniref:Uncharacterized protein n=1 Tax=termite gut metagenome TaxID=433724 RepID=A0A5J4QHZ4_9ZZZZ
MNIVETKSILSCQLFSFRQQENKMLNTATSEGYLKQIP